MLAVVLVVFVDRAEAQQNDAATTMPATHAVTPMDSLPAPVVDENAASSRLFMDKVEVLGTIAKPQALFILPGNDPKVDGIEIDRSFFREVFRPIEKDYHPPNTRRYLKEQVVW
jgi:hypothetical protein